MKKGSELEKVMNAVLAAGIIDIHKILKDIRQREDSGEVGEKITIEIPTEELDMMKELMLGDMFRSEDELLAFTQMMGLISMKYAIDHPDDFDLDLFFSEQEENMEKEGW
ncbi:MAG TPA: hypothetical protein ACFYEK_18080 [Candidatus Wunengus sp. YC60]|uniref:hypothetical protein n=1 Tax=Candidatus Wunengus sp. YC60 TaxID=3367697 RepID=UPI00402657F6